MPVLEAEELYLEYPTRAGALAVLQGVSLSLEQGEAVAVLGPSGCGKSSLLHLLGTLARPTRGRVWIQGQDPARLPEAELARIRNRTIGFIFQDHHLLPQCSALENVLLPSLARPVSERQGTEARARKLLEKVAWPSAWNTAPQNSLGEKDSVPRSAGLLFIIPPFSSPMNLQAASIGMPQKAWESCC